MATLERRSASSVPAHPSAPAATPAGPAPVVAPGGLLLIFVASFGIIAATWMLYGHQAEDMWSGYWGGMLGTVALLCAMGLRTTLPSRPLLGLVGLCGVGLILLGIAVDHGLAITISELVFGGLLLVGAGLYAAGRKS